MKQRRVALVSSGTAGHVYPALAVATTYQQMFENVNILCIGTPGGVETRIVPPLGYRLALVQGAPFFGVGMWGKLRAFRYLLRGISQARRVLRANRIKLVVGFGGYTSAGVLLAARSLGIRAAVHEANSVPGLTNTLLGHLVHRVYLGFEMARRAFPPERTLVTGNPVRFEIVCLEKENRRAPPGGDRPIHILVTGGSQGSPFLNQHVPDLLQRVKNKGGEFTVWHQVGNVAPEPVRAAYGRAGLSTDVVPYILDMAAAYRWADFAITCAGALTLAELAIAGLPALLVPLNGAAGDHQTANALAVAESPGGWWVSEADWDGETLAAGLAALLSNVHTWTRASERMRRLATPHAAQTLIADCEAMMIGRW